jgi:hypothetical protein
VRWMKDYTGQQHVEIVAQHLSKENADRGDKLFELPEHTCTPDGRKSRVQIVIAR